MLELVSRLVVITTLSDTGEMTLDAEVMREDRVILLVDSCLTMYFHLLLLVELTDTMSVCLVKLLIRIPTNIYSIPHIPYNVKFLFVCVGWI